MWHAGYTRSWIAVAGCAAKLTRKSGREHRMKLLAVHPSGLMYTRLYLRLEPLGLELIVAARVIG